MHLKLLKMVQDYITHCIFCRQYRRGSDTIWVSEERGPSCTDSSNPPKATGRAVNSRDVTQFDNLKGPPQIQDFFPFYVWTCCCELPCMRNASVLLVETKAPPLADGKRRLS